MKSQTRLSNFIFTLHFHALEKEMATHSVYGVAQSRTRLKRLSSSSSSKEARGTLKSGVCGAWLAALCLGGCPG